MDVLDAGFCAQYRADNDAVQALIVAAGNKFYAAYKSWEAQGKPAGVDMITYFGNETDDFNAARNALEAGDSSNGNERGGVRTTDCGAFQGYLRLETPSIEAFKLSVATLASGDKEVEEVLAGLTAFEIALRMVFKGQPLSAVERALVNGTLIARVKFTPFSGISTKVNEDILFVVPGSDLLNVTKYRRELLDFFWGGVDNATAGILDSLGTNIMNLNYAVQLRLGGDDPNSPLKPVQAGEGFVILGGV